MEALDLTFGEPQMPDPMNPLTCDPPIGVRLKNSPLDRVIAQVTHPVHLTLVENPAKMALIQEGLKEEFPVLEQAFTHELVFDLAAGVPKQNHTQSRIWNFLSQDRQWTCSISNQSFSLLSTKYTTRRAFFDRFELLARQIHEAGGPAHYSRLGVRYVDRVRGEEFQRVRSLLNEWSLGVLGQELGGTAQLEYAVTDFQAVAVVEEGARIHGRWGYCPSNGSFDPINVPPIQEPSWILDLDMYRQSPELLSLDPRVVTEEARRYARRMYAFFRWVVNDKFLEVFGREE